jgi:hypothetical protein
VSGSAGAGAPPAQGSSALELAPADEGTARPRPPVRRERSRGHAGAGTERRDGGFRDPLSVGERPRAPWHPLPLSEILILVGAIATIIGFRRGEAGKAVLFVGVGAVAIGTIEVMLREHRSGYRSHTIILAVLPTLAFHTAVSLLAAAVVSPVPTWLRIAPLALDVPLYAVTFKLLRARFLDARRERVFAGAR